VLVLNGWKAFALTDVKLALKGHVREMPYMIERMRA